VRRYAVLAGLEDRRTPPLDPRTLAELEVDISVLGPPRPLHEVGLRAIARRLVPHRDGVTLSCDDRSAFFLPVVWSSLPEPAQFLSHLCRKAGIDSQRDGDRCRAEIVEVFSFSDRPAVAR
jgi:AMMECR1 domain-containing protein